MIEDGQNIVNFKTMIIGRSAVGKSTLLLRYVDNTFNPQKPTIGIDYRYKKVKYDNNSYNLELWDSAGQERFNTIVYNYFNLSKAACVVFDLTVEQSLTDARNWMDQFVLQCGKQIPKILIGNKSDLLTDEKLKEQITKLQPHIDKIKQQYNCQFFVVSAFTGLGVEEAFNYLIKELVENNKKLGAPVKKNTFKLDQKKQRNAVEKKKKKKCCQ